MHVGLTNRAKKEGQAEVAPEASKEVTVEAASDVAGASSMVVPGNERMHRKVRPCQLCAGTGESLEWCQIGGAGMDLAKVS